MPTTLAELRDLSGTELTGDAGCLIAGVATLQTAGPGDISFLANRRYFRYLQNTNASAVVVKREDAPHCPVNALIADDPYLAFVRILRFFHPVESFLPGIDPTAEISHSARIASSAHIGAHVFIGDDVTIADRVFVGPGSVIDHRVTIGAGTRLTANVTLCRGVTLGKNGILHPGVVIGADGFGIVKDRDHWLKIPQVGSVIIGDDVEIGANTTIDRGALSDTVIENGVKIDNQVQIGHNAFIGANTAIAGCVAVAGSVTIGRNCMIGGLSAISGHIEIADNVVINGMSGITNSIKQPGQYGSATPAMEVASWRKNIVRLKHLDEIARRLNRLEDLVDNNKSR
ncbi:MAG: UDP-3-O-(3-hydroxymyristoyl)glucosamine N-acyltransferase [Gammaproteobacteria bacterium]|nr:MAG: UDP-3-O-(3-hydroxymyristoyl)glucosamine N-acyltransferase [Gammaproteobacteria bacterium]